MNNIPLEVTENLLAAMHHLRQERTSTTLWIDAICINQSDKLECSHQVRLMRDIYQKSSRVIVWLGPKSSHSDKAMSLLLQLSIRNSLEHHLFRESTGRIAEDVIEFREFVKRLPFATESERQSLVVPYDSECYKGVSELLNHAWFSRRWTFQEIVLAKNAVFRSGDKEVSLDVLGCALSWINTHLVYPMDHSEMEVNETLVNGYHAATGALLTRKEYQNKGKLDLMDVLAETWMRECVNPRDHIYSLLGVVKAPMITIDYNLSVEKVYQNFAETLIMSSKSLDILRMKQQPSNPALPSWVPDWSTTTGQNPPSAKGFYHAAGNLRARVSFGKSGYIRLQGIRVDMIAFTSVVAKVHDFPSDIRKSWEMVAYQDSSVDRFAIVDLEDERNSSYIRGGLKVEAFSRTLVADRWNDGRIHPDERVSSLLDLLGGSLPNDLQHWGLDSKKTIQCLDDLNSKIPRYRSLLQQEVRERRLFVTTMGYIGLAPPSAEKGDLVSVLCGGAVPFILRPHDCHFSMVGEAYGEWFSPLKKQSY